MTHLFLEIKTTGLNPKIDKICYLNFALYKNDVLVADFESWVDVGRTTWDAVAWHMNFPEYDSKAKCGQADLHKMLSEFFTHYLDEKAFIVAYEATFHQSFMTEFLGRDIMDKYFYSVPICVLQRVNFILQDQRQLFPNMKFPTLEAAYNLKGTKIDNLISLFHLK